MYDRRRVRCEVSACGQQLRDTAANNPVLPFGGIRIGFGLAQDRAGLDVEQHLPEASVAHDETGTAGGQDPGRAPLVGIAGNLDQRSARQRARSQMERPPRPGNVRPEPWQREVRVDLVSIDRSLCAGIVSPMSLGGSKSVQRSPRAVLEGIGGEAVVMHLDRDLFVRLNATARWLWDQLERPRTLEELADLLVDRYPAEAHRALVDVEAFVSALAERDLVALA